MKNPTLTVPTTTLPLPTDITISVRRGRFHAALKAVTPHACEDSTRFHMCTVAFELAERGQLNLITTNGHCLAKATIACAYDQPHLTTHPLVLLSTDDAKAAIKLLAGPKKTLDQQVTVGLSGKAIRIQIGTAIATYQLVDAMFPPYRQVVPSRVAGMHDGVNVARMSPEYLAMMGVSIDAFRSSNANGTRMQFGKTDLDPIRLDYDAPNDGEFVGVIMPMSE